MINLYKYIYRQRKIYIFLVIICLLILACKSKNQVVENISVDLTVTVPYWTSGDVYLAYQDDVKYFKLEKINEVTYHGKPTLEKNGEYFFSLGSDDSRSINSFTAVSKKSLNAVAGWKNIDKKIKKSDFQKGVILAGMKWLPEEFDNAEYNLKKLSDFGIEWVSIIPDWFMDNQTSTEISPFYANQGDFPNQSGWITPTLSDDQVRELLRNAKSFGYKTVLKPHVDIITFGESENSSRGAIKPSSWDKWFDNYTKFITHYAEIAQEENVDLFIIGTELDTASMSSLADCCGAPQDAEQRWRNVISEVKKYFNGLITYSVSCIIDNYEIDWKPQCHGPRDIKFWDALDYIGFEPYFGLTNKNDPSINEIKNGFDERLAEWAEPLSNQYNKKILFTEVAFSSYDGVNIKSLSGDSSSKNIDFQEQADLYEALFESIETKDYIIGTYFWAWYLQAKDTTLYDWINSQLEDTSDPFNGKLSGQVLEKWYSSINK